MKAIELPINVIVIITIIALVALGIISFFAKGWNPSADTLEMSAIKNSACLKWNCGRSGVNAADIEVSVDANKDGIIDSDDTLAKLCEKHYGDGGNTPCLKTCDC